jgi:hypothetical protein
MPKPSGGDDQVAEKGNENNTKKVVAIKKDFLTATFSNGRKQNEKTTRCNHRPCHGLCANGKGRRPGHQ